MDTTTTATIDGERTATAATDGKPALRADARRNREAVLAAARERFGECGLDCQMDDIARTGVGVGTVYRHFPTKEDLIAALVADRFERLAERAEQALAERDPWQAFCDLIRHSAAVTMRTARCRSSSAGIPSSVSTKPSGVASPT